MEEGEGAALSFVLLENRAVRGGVGSGRSSFGSKFRSSVAHSLQAARFPARIARPCSKSDPRSRVAHLKQ